MHTANLAFDRCPRCFAFGGVSVSLKHARSMFGRFVITTAHTDDAVVLALYGQLDAASKRCLEKALHQALASSCGRVVIDLSALEFIDWLGLQLLVRAREDALVNGLRLGLLRGPSSVHRLFELTGAARLFPFED